jgi:hypothetical protein
VLLEIALHVLDPLQHGGAPLRDALELLAQLVDARQVLVGADDVLEVLEQARVVLLFV